MLSVQLIDIDHTDSLRFSPKSQQFIYNQLLQKNGPVMLKIQKICSDNKVDQHKPSKHNINHQNGNACEYKNGLDAETSTQNGVVSKCSISSSTILDCTIIITKELQQLQQLKERNKRKNKKKNDKKKKSKQKQSVSNKCNNGTECPQLSVPQNIKKIDKVDQRTLSDIKQYIANTFNPKDDDHKVNIDTPLWKIPVYHKKKTKQQMVLRLHDQYLKKLIYAKKECVNDENLIQIKRNEWVWIVRIIENMDKNIDKHIDIGISFKINKINETVQISGIHVANDDLKRQHKGIHECDCFDDLISYIDNIEIRADLNEEDNKIKDFKGKYEQFKVLVKKFVDDPSDNDALLMEKAREQLQPKHGS